MGDDQDSKFDIKSNPMNSKHIIKLVVILIVGTAVLAFVNIKNDLESSQTKSADDKEKTSTAACCQQSNPTFTNVAESLGVQFAVEQPRQVIMEKKANFAISHGHCNLAFTGVIEGMGVRYNADQPQDLSVDFTINTESLKANGDSEELTKSIIAEEMFDGTGSNYINFKTEDIFRLGDNWYQLRGKMTIKDTEQVVRLRATPVRDNDRVREWVIEGMVDLDRFGIHAEDGIESEWGHVMFINLIASEGC